MSTKYHPQGRRSKRLRSCLKGGKCEMLNNRRFLRQEILQENEDITTIYVKLHKMKIGWGNDLWVTALLTVLPFVVITLS